MPHLKPRDILEFLLFAVCFTGLFAVAAIVETAPIAVALWLSAILAILLWVAYVIVVGQQRAREARAQVFIGGQWVTLDSNSHARHNIQIRTPAQPIFNQDDYKDHS